ncbi:MAG: adenylate/guanylate cyclase domain-containing protein [Candidatus Limnocylindrales bacterium]
MTRLQTKDMNEPDEVRQFPHGKVDIYELDDVVIGRTAMGPGWHWATDIKATAGTPSCQYHHIGVCVGGTLGVRMDDGSTMVIKAGEVFEIPPGHDGWVIGDESWVTYDFAGMRSFARPIESGDPILATILFTDVVDSTAKAEALGDRSWRELISRLNEKCQFELDRHRGRLIKTTGDGLLALFDSSERAVRCAAACTRQADALGVGIRAGVHTGEVELTPGDVRGLAVHVAARIMALAGGGEVFVSGTTRELLSGAGLTFEDQGEHELKGITGARRAYRLVQAAG